MSGRNGDNPNLGFHQPGVPVEIAPPVIIPLPAAPTRSTIPRPLSSAVTGKGHIPGTLVNVKPGTVYPSRVTVPNPFKKGPGSTLGPKITPGELKFFSEMHAKERYLKAAKLAKVGPYLTAFQIGWTLGDYLWPNGWYSLGVDGPPDQSAGPEGWTYTGPGGFAWTSCSPVSPCAVTGPFMFHTGFAGWHGTAHAQQCTPGSTCGATTGVDSLDVVASPWEAFAQPLPTVANTIAIKRQHTASTRWIGVGGGSSTGIATHADRIDPDNWTQVLTSTAPAPAPLAKARPSEHPETFPMEWPMEMPFAQPWSKAIPKAKTQGEGKHKSYVVGQTTIPRLPLAPFPVVVVVPPGGVVPPPVDQIIDIPPPPSFADGPYPVKPGKGPTFHTAPPRGRKPPGRKTKEKKLSVRSVANRAWIVLNLATEGFDFIDALFGALPKDCQKAAKPTIDYGPKGGGKADPYAKAQAVWNCFGEIDWDKFVNNFINQQLTDMAVGMIGMTAGRYLKMTGQATGSGGLASKPTATADDFLEAWVDEKVKSGEISKEQGDAILEGGKLPIPQVSYAGDGVWEVNIEAWGLTFR